MTKPILVTGGAGYIGSHVCKALKEGGFFPIAYDNLSLGHRWAVKWGPLVKADVCDYSALLKACADYRPLGIIHLAALSKVRQSEEIPLSYYQTNLVGTLNALTVAQKEGVSYFVFSSSCAVYGLPKTLPIPETHLRKPISTYGRSKWMIEEILKETRQTSGLCTATLRYFNAAGADPKGEIGEAHHPETHLIPLAIKTALKRRPSFTLYGNNHKTPDGTPIRDFIHVSDLAQGHVKALEYLIEKRRSFTLNLGTGKGYSVKEVINSVEKQLKCSLKIKLAPPFPKDPPILIANHTQALKVLNAKLRYSSLDQIVATAINWHQRYQG